MRYSNGLAMWLSSCRLPDRFFPRPCFDHLLDPVIFPGWRQQGEIGASPPPRWRLGNSMQVYHHMCSTSSGNGRRGTSLILGAFTSICRGHWHVYGI